MSATVPTAAELEARLLAIQGESYFEMLKIPLTASTEEVRAAYARQVFTYHPDRLPPELRELWD